MEETSIKRLGEAQASPCVVIKSRLKYHVAAARPASASANVGARGKKEAPVGFCKGARNRQSLLCILRTTNLTCIFSSNSVTGSSKRPCDECRPNTPFNSAVVSPRHNISRSSNPVARELHFDFVIESLFYIGSSWQIPQLPDFLPFGRTRSYFDPSLVNAFANRARATAQTSMASTVTPLTQVYCITRETSRAESWEANEPTKYKLASRPAVTPPVVMTRIPPSGMAERLAMDSRRRESRKALLPLRAIDFRRACPVLVPSSTAGGSRDFWMMYLVLVSIPLYKAVSLPLTGCHLDSRPDRSGHC